MMLALLLAALAVSVVGVVVSRRWRVPGQALMVLGGLGLIAVLALQVRQNVFPPQLKPPGRAEMAVSTVLANCVLRDLSSRNGDIILLFPPRRSMDADTEQSYEEGFTLPLRHGHGNLHLKALHLAPATGQTGYDLAAFKQVIEQAPDALGFISYAGVPKGFETLFSAPQSPGPFYVFDPDATANWLPALKSRRIRAVVLARPGVKPGSRESVTGMPQDIFDRFYLLATPETADQMAAQINRK